MNEESWSSKRVQISKFIWALHLVVGKREGHQIQDGESFLILKQKKLVKKKKFNSMNEI